jgi:DNA-binding MarR family transcriptional regulator
MSKPTASADRLPRQDQRRVGRFPYWFARISRALSQHLLLHVTAELDVNLAEYRILDTLSDLDSVSIRDIAADSSLDKAQVTRAVADLTKRGLVVQMVDGRDRRLRVVKLTPAGRKLIDAALPFVMERQRQLEQLLTPAERRVVWKALAALSDEAERLLAANERTTTRRKRRS